MIEMVWMMHENNNIDKYYYHDDADDAHIEYKKSYTLQFSFPFFFYSFPILFLPLKQIPVKYTKIYGDDDDDV